MDEVLYPNCGTGDVPDARAVRPPYTGTYALMSTEHDLLRLTVDKAARVAAVTDVGEIMISSTTRDLVGSIEGTRMAEPEVVAPKGLSNTHQIVAVEWD